MPYALWHINGLNPDYSYDLSYIPAVVYIIGYFAFILGARIGRSVSLLHPSNYSLPSRRLKPVVLVVIVAGAVQFCLAAKLYGGVPLLNYLQESTDVWEVNSLQSGSFMGQFGLLTFTTFLLSVFSMLILVKTTRPSLFTVALVASSVILCVLISSMAGKRQGLLMCAFIVGCGVMTRLGNPIRHILLFMGLSPRFRSSFLLNAATLFVWSMFFFLYLAVLGGLRTGERQFGVAAADIIRYLEFPLINFESQAEIVGYGPHRYDATALLAGFLPQKILDSSEALSTDTSFYLEPTASAGIYGPLHLYSGLAGCMVFAVFLGAFCKFVHVQALTNDLYLMIYAQCAWPLFVSYSFNLFIRLIFVVGPILAYCVFCFLLRSSSKSRPMPAVRCQR